MSYRVVVTVRSRADGLKAFRWLADRSPDAAARWYTELKKGIESLSMMPERCPVAIEETEQLGITLRELLSGERPGVYRILFSVEGNTVTIHYVRHSAQGPIDLEPAEPGA